MRAGQSCALIEYVGMNRLLAIVFVAQFGCGGRPSGAPTRNPVPDSSDESASSAEGLTIDEDIEPVYLSRNDGVRVVLLPLASSDGTETHRKFLVRATGTESKHDGLVVVARRSLSEGMSFYVARLRGEPRVILSQRAEGDVWTLRGYGDTNREDLALSRTEPFVTVKKVVDVRRSQREANASRIETDDRQEMERWQEKRLAELSAKALDSCPDVNLKMDWSHVRDAMFDGESIAGKCTSFVFGINDFCESHPHVAEKMQREISFVCAYRGDSDDKANARLQHDTKGTYVFSPGFDNAQNEILHYLRKTLGELDQVLRVGEKTFILRYSESGVKVYYGTDETFYPVGSGSVREPYLHLDSGYVETALSRTEEGRTWELRCNRESWPMQTLLGSERKAVLERAKVETQAKWKREPYFLSRDTRGNYYYVDRYKREFGGKRYRVFVGRRGGIQLTKLKGVVEDSEGTLFSTESGDLRLLIDSGTKKGTWIQQKRTIPLTPVRTDRNAKLIYDELGVYLSGELGFVCD